MNTMLDTLRSDGVRQWLPLVTLVILVILVGTFQPAFLDVNTLLQLASDTAVLFILATGVTFVIMLGGIDLSIQSMASLSSVVVALTLARYGYAAFVFAFGLGVLAGLLSGIAHVRLRIPSFIATLAMGGVLYSAALVTSRERWALMHELRGEREMTLAETLARLSPCDLVLIEGYKAAPIPKLEIWRPAAGKPLLFPRDPHIIAIATDSPDPLPARATGGALRRFSLEDTAEIATLVLAEACRSVPQD